MCREHCYYCCGKNENIIALSWLAVSWRLVCRLLCRHWEKFNVNTQTNVTTTTHFTIITIAMLLRCFIGNMRWRVSQSFNEITNYFHNDFHPIFHWKLPPEWLMRETKKTFNVLNEEDKRSNYNNWHSKFWYIYAEKSGSMWLRFYQNKLLETCSRTWGALERCSDDINISY